MGSMKNLLQNIHRLSRRKRLAIYTMVILIVLTWLAVCVVFASILAP
jgi:cytochrome c1